eukprot:g1811.t1
MVDWGKTNMEYRKLGGTGLKVSALSLGAWTTYGGTEDEKRCYECMTAALRSGVNYFDNAEVYASGRAEIVMGKTIKKWTEEKLCRRSDLVIATKIFWGSAMAGVKGNPNATGLSRKHIIEGTRDSLERLQLKYVDLIFCHREDFDTPIEETVRAMNFIIDQGLAFYWGTSEWSADGIVAAVECAKRLGLQPPVMEQPQYSLLHRRRFEVEYDSLYARYKYGTTIWSPLACGLLTGKYSGGKFPEGSRLAQAQNAWLKKQLLDGEDGGGNGLNGLEVRNPQEALRMADSLKPIAQELNCTQAQLALAWCLANKNVSTVITGASRVSQVHENMKALDIAKKLTPKTLEKIDGVLKNRPIRPKDWGRGRRRSV